MHCETSIEIRKMSEQKPKGKRKGKAKSWEKPKVQIGRIH